MEMVERAAKAVAPELMRLFDGEAPHRTERPDYWEACVSDKDKEQVRGLVRLMIEAMDEPTEEMMALGNEEAETCIKDDPCGKAGRHVWRTMPGAALKDS